MCALALLALLLLLSPASGSPSLSSSARAYALDDLKTTYNRYQAFPGAETLCPTSITHAAFTSSGARAGTVPHASISHAGKACTSTGSMRVLPLKEALADADIKAQLAKDTMGVIAGAVTFVLNGSDSLLGFESEARVCGEKSAVGLPAGSAFLLVHEEKKNVTLVPSVAVLPAGPRHAALFVQDGKQFIGCLYSDAAPKDVAESTDPAAAKSTPASDKGGAKCFPADATVEMASGETRRMDELAVGDVVRVGPTEYSPVFMFTHRAADAAADLVSLETACGARIRLTAGHYIYANGALVAAANVRVGDALALGGGAAAAVVARVRRVRGAGLYNPQTLHGDVVVDGVLASTYTTAVEPVFAHALLAVFRGAWAWFGVGSRGLLDGGGRGLEAALPGGVAVY